MADMGAQPKAIQHDVKPGVYGAEGDDWNYRVTESGDIEVKDTRKADMGWLTLKPGTEALNAVLEQLTTGDAKGRKLSRLDGGDGAEKPKPAWADIDGVAARAMKTLKGYGPGGADDPEQAASFAGKASNEPMMDSFPEKPGPVRGKAPWQRGEAPPEE